MNPLYDVNSIIRVNQAGEYGAKRIYQGQLRILKNTPSAPVIEEMYIQEVNHLQTFDDLMVRDHVRPTLFQPLWHVGAYLLGAGTALLGEKAAMACTAAVEEVIDEHYQDQIASLGTDHPALSQVIEKFWEDECHHRDTAYDRGARQAPAYPILSDMIKTTTRLAIALSKRI